MRARSLLPPLAWIFCLALGANAPCGAVAAEQAATRSPESIRGEVATLLRDLDNSRYEVRQEAARRLEEMITQPEMRGVLAAEFQRLSVQPDVSFEVRWHLSRWRTKLPKVEADPPQSASPSELDRLVRQLDDDSYSTRLGAVERLKWLSGNARQIGPIMVRLKQRLAEPGLSTEACRRLEAIREMIRGIWLMTPSADADLPPVSQDQLQRWLDELARPAQKPEPPGDELRRRAAHQELLDLLARDAEVPRVKAALQSRLAGPLPIEAQAAFKEALELTRPAMVAEFWQGRGNRGVQHLLVGVPSQVAGAARPSHFDRIDDREAHCVSGNSLSADTCYPVGVAFPHPKQPDAIFHLVNLPTPRRRMAFEYYVKTDEAERLIALSRRTLERFLAQKHLLTDSEVLMLGQLDVGEVSRFAGKYFLLVEDSLVEDEPQSPWADRGRPGGQASRHNMICGLLAVDGTKRAIPGLLEAIRQKRFLPPTPVGPYWLSWLAAFSIANRDPWPEVDLWLVEVLGNREILVLGRPEGPEVGATAARILLKRYHEPLGSFNLEVAPDSLLATTFGIEGYRYRTTEGPEQIRAWWKRRANGPKPEEPPSK